MLDECFFPIMSSNACVYIDYSMDPDMIIYIQSNGKFSIIVQVVVVLKIHNKTVPL